MTHSSESKQAAAIEKRLKEAVEIAEERAAYESAHNERLLRALTVVAEFIKRKKRVCYGGTAMNAILPPAKRFYNPDYDLPDYDFYTPDLNGDVADLVADLKAAGFADVYHRVGIHEGTKKILVDFVAVADVSAIDPELFSVFLKRSVTRDGVHYTDPDILRMMMYLELSRPKGQVSRWEKVFERLELINATFPVRGGGAGGGQSRSATRRCKEGGRPIPEPVREIILNHIIENQRVLCSGPVLGLYARGIRKGDAIFRLHNRGGAALFTSPAPKEDALRLRDLLARGHGTPKLFLHKARGEIVPERYEVRMNGRPVCMIVEEVACHSYNNFPLEDGRILNIGSPEFLITLYLSLHIFTKKSRFILGPQPMCLIAQLVRLAHENYVAKHSQFPAFSLNCRGHQTGYASLVRQKVLRIQAEKGARGTRKRSASSRTV